MTPLVQVRDLTRDYVSRPFLARPHVLRALDAVSMTIDAGSIVGIVGESGSGKSTLARLVMALDKPTSGNVLFEGEDLFSLPPSVLKRRRRNFQMVFQDPFASLDPRQIVARIVAEPLHLLDPRPTRREARALAIEMLQRVGLPSDAADRYPHEFSGGQRQRIALARALITRPKLVVADEPVSALDLSVQAQVLNLILDLRDAFGTAFLFVSHDLAVIECIADRIEVMHRGRIVENGATADVLHNPRHPYTQSLLKAQAQFDIKKWTAPGGAVHSD